MRLMSTQRRRSPGPAGWSHPMRRKPPMVAMLMGHDVFVFLLLFRRKQFLGLGDRVLEFFISPTFQCRLLGFGVAVDQIHRGLLFAAEEIADGLVAVAVDLLPLVHVFTAGAGERVPDRFDFIVLIGRQTQFALKP